MDLYDDFHSACQGFTPGQICHACLNGDKRGFSAPAYKSFKPYMSPVGVEITDRGQERELLKRNGCVIKEGPRRQLSDNYYRKREKKLNGR